MKHCLQYSRTLLPSPCLVSVTQSSFFLWINFDSYILLFFSFYFMFSWVVFWSSTFAINCDILVYSMWKGNDNFFFYIFNFKNLDLILFLSRVYEASWEPKGKYTRFLKDNVNLHDSCGLFISHTLSFFQENMRLPWTYSFGYSWLIKSLCHMGLASSTGRYRVICSSESHLAPVR